MFYPIHVIMFVASAALGTFAGPDSTADRVPNQYAQVCEQYPTLAETGAGFCSWRLSACGDGVVYLDPKTEREVFVPWARIVHWRLDEHTSVPFTAGSDPQATFHLKLTESRGLFAQRASHAFVICGTRDERRDLERTLKEQLGLFASR